MLPLNLLSKLVIGFGQSGMSVVLENADDDKKKAIQIDIEEASLGVMNSLKDRYLDKGYTDDEAKTMAMVTMAICTGSIMEVVGSSEND